MQAKFGNMEQYIVSARKYRPTTFQSVVGQKNLTETLQNAIRQNHLAHAYLFCGPRGVGKTTCARIFAKTINCLNPTDTLDACNACESCVAFNEQRSFNIHELDAASNNSVEDIRALIQEVRIPPQIGKYSVYIIDEVHMLSQGAFNALLKTLEEPPSYVIFILATTEKHKVLPTILSRCQVYDFQRITVRDTIEHLQYVAKQEGITVEEQALAVVAEKADGGMRDALSIFDQLVAFCGNTISYSQAIEVLNVLDSDYYFRMEQAALQGNVPQAMLLFNEVLQKGFDAGQFVVGLMQHLRDVMMAKDPATAPLLETTDSIRSRFVETAKLCTAVWLFDALDVLNTCDVQYRTAKNKRLTVELALVKLCRILKPGPASPQGEATAVSVPKEQQPVANANANVNIQHSQLTPTANIQRPQPTPTANANAIPTVKKLPSLNLNAQAATAPVAAPKPESEEGPQQNAPFTIERLREVWAGLGEHFRGEDRLVAMIRTHYPVLKSDTLAELRLTNPWQKEEFGKFGKQVMDIVRRELGNNQLKLQVSVAERKEVETAFTAEEKYKLLATLNPALSEMKSVLGMVVE